MSDAMALLERVHARLSYKPESTFSVQRLSGDLARISIRSVQADAHAGSSAMTLSIHENVSLHAIHTQADALHAFARLIAKFELHEAAEFLQLDGETIFLPHRAGAEQDGFSWEEFARLGGRYLRALNQAIEPDASLDGEVARGQG